jgi:pSer/pThr/pTyr-binding forkhead associated (FHA) protein
MGDMTFASDPLVSEPHCAIEEQAGSVVLTDLGSRAGTFVRVTGERELVDGDELAIGRTRLKVSIP